MTRYTRAYKRIIDWARQNPAPEFTMVDARNAMRMPGITILHAFLQAEQNGTFIRIPQPLGGAPRFAVTPSTPKEEEEPRP